MFTHQIIERIVVFYKSSLISDDSVNDRRETLILYRYWFFLIILLKIRLKCKVICRVKDNLRGRVNIPLKRRTFIKLQRVLYYFF